MKKIITLLCMLLGFTAAANAVTYTMDLSELSGLSLISSLSSNATLSDVPTLGNITGGPSIPEESVWYEVNLKAPVLTSSSAEPNAYGALGKTYSSPLDLSNYDDFGLALYNSNDDKWGYKLFVTADGVTKTSDEWTWTLSDQSVSLRLDLLAGLDRTNVTALGFIVGSRMGAPAAEGWPSIGDYAHVNVAPVPEPATMVMLGTGLLGLIGVNRKKLFKK